MRYKIFIQQCQPFLNVFIHLSFHYFRGMESKPCDVTKSWNNKGDIVIGNDVWIGFEAVIMAGVTIGDGAVIGARALVTKRHTTYTIVGGVPASQSKNVFSEKTIETLLQIRWWDWSKRKYRSIFLPYNPAA